MNGNWRRNLKQWDGSIGNYNGFVFRLEPQDFPLYAGYWFEISSHAAENRFDCADDLARMHGSLFTGEIVNKESDTERGQVYCNWVNFEIIIPRLMKPARILKIIHDRVPRSKKTSRPSVEAITEAPISS